MKYSKEKARMNYLRSKYKKGKITDAETIELDRLIASQGSGDSKVVPQNGGEASASSASPAPASDPTPQSDPKPDAPSSPPPPLGGFDFGPNPSVAGTPVGGGVAPGQVQLSIPADETAAFLAGLMARASEWCVSKGMQTVTPAEVWRTAGKDGLATVLRTAPPSVAQNTVPILLVGMAIGTLAPCAYLVYKSWHDKKRKDFEPPKTENSEIVKPDKRNASYDELFGGSQ